MKLWGVWLRLLGLEGFFVVFFYNLNVLLEFRFSRDYIKFIYKYQSIFSWKTVTQLSARYETLIHIVIYSIFITSHSFSHYMELVHTILQCFKVIQIASSVSANSRNCICIYRETNLLFRNRECIKILYKMKTDFINYVILNRFSSFHCKCNYVLT